MTTRNTDEPEKKMTDATAPPHQLNYQRGAAVQSTENNSEPRYQSAKTIDEVVEEAQTVVWKDATYFTANEVLALAAALAAERDRADRAEAALAEAWDEGFMDGERKSMEGDDGPRFVNPYRSEATA